MPSTDIDTLSLHDALPISGVDDESHGAAAHLLLDLAALAGADVETLGGRDRDRRGLLGPQGQELQRAEGELSRLADPVAAHLVDRKSTRLNSSHLGISYAVHRHRHPFPTRRSSDLGRR